MADPARVLQLCGMLRRFIQGEDRTGKFGDAIRVVFDEVFPEDERFSDVVFALETYSPAGGDFMYNEERIMPLLKWALAELNKDGYCR